MDWFSWLSKTSLDHSLVYEYGLAFSHNELEENDIYHLNHEFLQSMGISIAKHRLEIIKLARRERGSNKLIFAIKRTKKTLGEYFQALVRRDKSALVIVSKRICSSRWRGDMMKREKSSLGKREKLLLTNGTSALGDLGSKIERFPSPAEYDTRRYDKTDGYDDPYWRDETEEIKWEAMFQDLKPT